MPDFPRTLQYDDDIGWWRGTISLPAFNTVNIDIPPRKAAAKRVKLFVEADEDGPSAAQAATDAYLRENQEKVLRGCFTGIAKVAKQMRPILADYTSRARLEALLPKYPKPEHLRSRVRLASVVITDRVKRRDAHVEYTFDCAWEREHPLLVVLLRDRLVYAGGSGDGW